MKIDDKRDFGSIENRRKCSPYPLMQGQKDLKELLVRGDFMSDRKLEELLKKQG